MKSSNTARDNFKIKKRQKNGDKQVTIQVAKELVATLSLIVNNKEKLIFEELSLDHKEKQSCCLTLWSREWILSICEVYRLERSASKLEGGKESRFSSLGWGYAFTQPFAAQELASCIMEGSLLSEKGYESSLANRGRII